MTPYIDEMIAMCYKQYETYQKDPQEIIDDIYTLYKWAINLKDEHDAYIL